MKYLLLFVLFLYSCGSGQREEQQKELIDILPVKDCTYELPDGLVNYRKEVEIVVIDGCEYIVIGRGLDAQSISHKGNCSNPIHGQTSGRNTLIVPNTVIIHDTVWLIKDK